MCGVKKLTLSTSGGGSKNICSTTSRGGGSTAAPAVSTRNFALFEGKFNSFFTKHFLKSSVKYLENIWKIMKNMKLKKNLTFPKQNNEKSEISKKKSEISKNNNNEKSKIYKIK